MPRKLTSTLYENERRLEEACPFAFALSRLGTRWRPAILWKVADGHTRYGALRRALPTITEKSLGDALRSLTGSGLLERRAGPGRAPRSEYALTEGGRALLPVLRALEAWSRPRMAGASHDQRR